MKSHASILLGLLAFSCPAVTRATPPPSADIRRDFAALATAASPRSITAEEWEVASFALFQGADRNQDNFLETAELGSGAISRDTLVTADENRDAKLSVTEFMQVRRAIFKASDMDRDDALTYFEFELLVVLGQYGWTDANRNGRVEVSELKEALAQSFTQLDPNHDGKLTQEEVPYMGVSQWRLADADQNGSVTSEEFIRGYLLSLGAI